jgi:hypothetical protein
MTVGGPVADHAADGAAVVARLFARPHLLEALAQRDTATLRREVTIDPELLAMMADLDVAALRFSLRRLQRKRLEVIAPIFPVSLPAACGHFGADDLAAQFWDRYQPPARIAVQEIVAAIAGEWIQFTRELACPGPLRWLNELSRYEHMRWQATLLAEPSPAAAVNDEDGDQAQPSLAPGARADTFAVDVSALLGAASGGPGPDPATIRLITWYQPGSGVRTARLGAVLYDAVQLCDGTRTIGQVAAAAADRAGPAATERVRAGLRALALAGAIRR